MAGISLQPTPSLVKTSTYQYTTDIRALERFKPMILAGVRPQIGNK